MVCHPLYISICPSNQGYSIKSTTLPPLKWHEKLSLWAKIMLAEMYGDQWPNKWVMEQLQLTSWGWQFIPSFIWHIKWLILCLYIPSGAGFLNHQHYGWCLTTRDSSHWISTLFSHFSGPQSFDEGESLRKSSPPSPKTTLWAKFDQLSTYK